MKKVYNKKRGTYKGSIPGMRMGGVLRRADEGTETEEVVTENVNEESVPVTPVEESRGWPYTERSSWGDGWDMYNQGDIYGNPRKGMWDRLTTEGPISAVTGSAPARWANTAWTVMSDEIPRAFRQGWDYKKGGTKRKKGGTVLGGKYKRGGSTKASGRNGVL